MSAQLNMTQTTPCITIQYSRKTLIGILVGLVVVALLGMWAWRASHKTTSTSATVNSSHPNRVGAKESQPAAVNSSAQAQIDVLTTTLGPTGFTPTVIDHAAGSFKLKVKNESEQEEVVLRLSNASGEKLSEVTVSNKAKAWISKFDLPPGTYTLSEASHPTWTCQISLAAP